MNTLYKVLGANASPIHGGSGDWFLPKGKRPGKWMPAIPLVQVPQTDAHPWWICRCQDCWRERIRFQGGDPDPHNHTESSLMNVTPNADTGALYRFRQWLADVPVVSLVFLKLCYSDSGRSLVHAEWRWKQCAS